MFIQVINCPSICSMSGHKNRIPSEKSLHVHKFNITSCAHVCLLCRMSQHMILQMRDLCNCPHTDATCGLYLYMTRYCVASGFLTTSTFHQTKCTHAVPLFHVIANHLRLPDEQNPHHKQCLYVVSLLYVICHHIYFQVC